MAPPPAGRNCAPWRRGGAGSRAASARSSPSSPTGRRLVHPGTARRGRGRRRSTDDADSTRCRRRTGTCAPEAGVTSVRVGGPRRSCAYGPGVDRTGDHGTRRQPPGPPPSHADLANQQLLWSSPHSGQEGATESRSGSRAAHSSVRVRPVRRSQARVRRSGCLARRLGRAAIQHSPLTKILHDAREICTRSCRGRCAGRARVTHGC